MKNIFLLTFIAVLLVSCKDDRPQSTIDEETIQEYLEVKNLNATKHASGLYYVVEESGKAPFPKYNSNVDIIYKGYFTNDDVFDESDNKAINLNLENTIRGWQFGVPLFGAGGKGKLIIPSRLGYGVYGSNSGGVPGNAVIIFDIEIVAVY